MLLGFKQYLARLIVIDLCNGSCRRIRAHGEMGFIEQGIDECGLTRTESAEYTDVRLAFINSFQFIPDHSLEVAVSFFAIQVSDDLMIIVKIYSVLIGEFEVILRFFLIGGCFCTFIQFYFLDEVQFIYLIIHMDIEMPVACCLDGVPETE